MAEKRGLLDRVCAHASGVWSHIVWQAEYIDGTTCIGLMGTLPDGRRSAAAVGAHTSRGQLRSASDIANEAGVIVFTRLKEKGMTDFQNDRTAFIYVPNHNGQKVMDTAVPCRAVNIDNGYLTVSGAEGPVAIYAPGAWHSVSLRDARSEVTAATVIPNALDELE